MSAAEVAAAASSGIRTKPVTRSSIRQSLTLSSMGKALADVMNKEPSADKAKAKKTKDARRSSLLAPTRSSAERQSLTRQEKDERGASPENRTITKHSRRMSSVSKGTSSPEPRSSSPASTISPKATIPTRASTLRPRTSLNSNGSALPKYRPKSLLVEPTVTKKPPSPARAGTRRRLSSSEDDEDDESDRKGTIRLTAPKSAEKTGRPISPLPHRNALKVNLSSAIQITPSTPRRDRTGSSTPTSQMSPTRRNTSPQKPKATKPSSPVRSAIPRPSSSASSSSSARGPQTPKTPRSLKGVFSPASGSGKPKSTQGSPLRTAITISEAPDSPSSRLSGRKKATSASPSTPQPIAAPTIFTEGSSLDSIEADDVEYLLGSMASPSAPTPFLPRIQTRGGLHGDSNPSTPSRQSSFLPSRANLSYLSPAPPNSDASPFLRPRPARPGNDRGSILSWEQLTQSQRSMDSDEVTHMLYDIPAPFRSGAVSPAPSSLPDIPESPSLSSLPSPTSFGSISQVLLPDVTPSPAIHNGQRFAQLEPDADSSTITFLRLQLASVENSTQEQAMHIQSLEQQLQMAKDARLRDAEELARQISDLEEQVQGNLSREADRAEYTATLEEALTHAHTASENAVTDAVKRASEDAMRSQQDALARLDSRWKLSAAAADTATLWKDVRCSADAELEMIHANREMLAVLLAGLHPLQL
ncbi:hypothetical protein EIP91_007536 [Steccherinum ochraceum]|uniref:Uncharacterized protein n=1 Tax=Steccherinum ochraceum TaxID=92696 RepID=A0A4R0R444_9APHY|nr:hypothetical protein EIP91_007536 [Steccherinum ochraceum]